MLVKLAFGNLKRNFHNYWTYFVSAAFSAFVLYLFLSITFGKVTGSAAQYSATAVVFAIGAFLTATFTIFFIWYSNTFFIKSRKKEFATYMLLGMSKKQTSFLSFIENLVILVLAYATGIAAGLLLNKFLIMLLYGIMQVNASVPFEINTQALAVCSYIYLGVFVLICIHTSVLINRNSLLDLMNASKKAQKVLKVKKSTYAIGVLALACLAFGYCLSVFGAGNAALWGPIVLFVCIGTALFFTSIAALFFHFKRKNEQKLYNGTELITTSQLMYRYKGNVGVLSVIAITTSVALCAVLACFSLFNKVEDNTRLMRPFSVEYTQTGVNADALFQKTLQDHPEVSVTSSVNLALLKANAKTDKAKKPYGYFLIGESNYNQAMEALGRDKVSLKGDKDCLLVKYSTENEYTGGISVSAGTQTFPFQISHTESRVFMSLDRFTTTLVVPDSAYGAIKSALGVPELVFKEYQLSSDAKSGDFIAELQKNLPKESKLQTFYAMYRDSLSLWAVMFFVGVFIGLLFVAATGSILYFRMSMEAGEDREKYITLQKIGVSGREIRNSAAKQMGIVFGAPLVLAFINAYFALCQLERILSFSMKGTFLLVIAAYTLFYGLYYLLTLNKYVKTISRA